MIRLLRFAAVTALFCFIPASRASIALVVGEPFGAFGAMMPVGHAAIFLDHICADSPTQLRPCRAGEQGVVLSRYHDLKTTHTDWLAFPLSVFLYGVALPEDAPATMTPPQATLLREQYRADHLAAWIPERIDRSGLAHAPKQGDWAEGIGSTFDRNVYLYEIDTTPAQDAELLRQINADSNRRRYTLGRANCADFAADLLRTVLPGVFHRKVWVDFDMTTPKTLAEQLDRYGRAHPERHLRIFEAPQLPGPAHRSRPVRGAAESILINRLYLATLIVIQPEVPLACWAIYAKGGRWKVGNDAAPVPPELWQHSAALLVQSADEAAGVQ